MWVSLVPDSTPKPDTPPPGNPSPPPSPQSPDISQPVSPEKILVCPQCKSRYQPKRSVQGRRVRCRHCGHVWRDQTSTLKDVTGALGTAATLWVQLGSTVLAEQDHPDAVGQMVSKARKPLRERPPPSKWVGQTLGRYKIISVLGQGAMGYVYEAYDQNLKRKVALKMLPLKVESGRGEMGLKLFLQEARLAARLQHPNIVTIYEVAQQEGMYFFAMELVSGMTLAAIIESSGPLAAQQACYVIAQVARALSAGHDIGAVHRDVKPGNIMIDDTGHVKLTDFGLADVSGIKGLKGIEELRKQTLGTPGWISPEVARGEHVTPSSDIYGLGLTLYYAMSKDRLIKGDSRSGMLKNQREAKSLRREQLPAGWPPRLRDIIVQCLQADPKDRYQSAEVLAADLLQALTPPETDATLLLDKSRMLSSPASLLADDETPPKLRLVSPVLSWIALGLLGLVTVAFAVWWWLLR